MTISKKQKENLRNSIESEGFDYAFNDYSDWNEIKDKEFHALLKNWRDARDKFVEFLTDNDVSTDGESEESEKYDLNYDPDFDSYSDEEEDEETE